MDSKSFVRHYLDEVIEITSRLDVEALELLIEDLAIIRRNGGRLFFLGIGGSAANASHAVNDFRKICDFEAYSATDNVAELTARTNDQGWEHVFDEWLMCNRISSQDAVFILSVGGGTESVSRPLVQAVKLVKGVGAKLFSIVGRAGGFAHLGADRCMLIPSVNAETLTPHAEEFQSVILHMLVSHPTLKRNSTTW